MPRLYPSIPHLPGSRAAGDKTLTHQARACIDPTAAKPGAIVIVEEKLDGSCVVIAREDGRLVARGREGRLASESGNEARRWFAAWVAANETRLSPAIGEGEVLAGEWLALVHGTRYRLSGDPFVPFDVFYKRKRLPTDAVRERATRVGLVTPPEIHRGAPLPIDDARRILGAHGLFGAIDPAEGVVYRVERGGDVVLVAKWVRPDKIDGALLPENTGEPALYNWTPP